MSSWNDLTLELDCNFIKLNLQGEGIEFVELTPTLYAGREAISTNEFTQRRNKTVPALIVAQASIRLTIKRYTRTHGRNDIIAVLMTDVSGMTQIQKVLTWEMQ